jgi:hypothetical protein
MSKNRPNIITLLGDYNILIAGLLIISLFPISKGFEITVQLPGLSIPNVKEEVTRMLFALLLMGIAYGYLKLKKWGYWLLISKNLVLIVAWLIYNAQHQRYLFASFPILFFVELIYAVPTFGYFYARKYMLH